eukprot:scaffold102205_cov19-Tisochrysis_lutea.AAC.3
MLYMRKAHYSLDICIPAQLPVLLPLCLTRSMSFSSSTKKPLFHTAAVSQPVSCCYSLPTHRLLCPVDLDVPTAQVRPVLRQRHIHVHGVRQHHKRLPRQPSVPLAQHHIDGLHPLKPAKWCRPPSTGHPQGSSCGSHTKPAAVVMCACACVQSEEGGRWERGGAVPP